MFSPFFSLTPHKERCGVLSDVTSQSCIPSNPKHGDTQVEGEVYNDVQGERASPGKSPKG